MPPYREAEDTTCPPFSARLSRAMVSAAWPLATASAATPPSRDATRSSNTAWVGFMIRV